MQGVAKAIIVVTCDDVNDYFLVIDLATGKEIKRVDTWRRDDNYDEDEMVAKVAESCLVREYTVIRWY